MYAYNVSSVGKCMISVQLFVIFTRNSIVINNTIATSYVKQEA